MLRLFMVRAELNMVETLAKVCPHAREAQNRKGEVNGRNSLREKSEAFCQ